MASLPVTVFGVKETIPSPHGAVLEATFTVVSPEQISESSGGPPELDLEPVTFFKKEGKYKLLQGNLEEALAKYMDKLVAKQTVTISFDLDVRDCQEEKVTSETNNNKSVPTKQIYPQTTKRLIRLEYVLSKIEEMRIKAVAQRTF